MTQSGEPADVLFYEQGASWLWVLAGPMSAVAMLLIQLSAGYGVQLLIPAIFFVLVTGFLALQVKAAQDPHLGGAHPDHLRQGTETHLDRRHRADLSGTDGLRTHRSGSPPARSAS